MRFKHAYLALAALLFASCAAEEPDPFAREDKFILEIGPMEDQISLFDFYDDVGLPRAGVAMADGFFFISDGGGRKVARYSSFGDLLFLIFNDETNPEPSGLRIRTIDDGLMTRWAYSFPFRSPGRVAVDSRRNIFVEEILPEERHMDDDESLALLGAVILHFDENGSFIDYIGQGGRGGLPFPYVVGLQTSADDEIVVTCFIPGGRDVFWFDENGSPLFIVHVRNETAPAPPGHSDFFASIDSVFPAPDSRKLFVKVDYYREVMEPLTGNLVGMEAIASLVWTLNVESGVYESFAQVPFFEGAGSEWGEAASIPFSMIGAARGGSLLFSFPERDGYAIMRMDSSGGGQRRGNIRIDPSRLIFNSFHLSPEGILSAILADEWTASVSWWRLESFMRDG
ncbi:MAG: hypothetical protein FWE09_08250 [Treponema sp.]|nr:hypothetical protein [Treponema sp.]